MKKVMFGLLFAVFLLFSALSMAEIGDVEQQLTASDIDQGDWFGQSVSIYSEYVIVGAPGNEYNGYGYSGSAYIFKRNNDTWGNVTKLMPSDVTDDFFFGWSVCISGDHAIVGAPGDDVNGFHTGSAYVFKKKGETWIEVAKLTASDGSARDEFGFSVSISGNRAIVGSRVGSAYVFERVEGVWGEVIRLTASDGDGGDGFGNSVSISANRAIVGSSLDGDNGLNSGAAYVFERKGGTWVEVTKLTASDGIAWDKFGGSVSLSGNHAIVGTCFYDNNSTRFGSAYVFERTNGIWREITKLTASDSDAYDNFGCSVSISGNHAIVGATLDDDNGDAAGSAYVFERKDNNWSKVLKLTASDGAENDLFGYSVSISLDQIIVGAYGYGKPPGVISNYYSIGSAYIYSND